MEIDKDLLASEIRRRREALGHTQQKAFAKLADIDYGTLNRIETGKGKKGPDIDTLYKISRALGCTMDALVNAPPPPQVKPNPPLWKVLRAYEKAESPEKRKQVLRALGLLEDPDLDAQLSSIRSDAPEEPQSRKKDK